MNTFFRILGHRGNTTIPYPLRLELGIAPYDLISYKREGDHIVVQKERVCDGCSSQQNRQNDELKELLSSLSFEAKREALYHLASSLAGGADGSKKS
jgi:bifunctional DNA-binding transcriptional regulator/antitoxin component of YhaV-PrlF toxin-antitoxin module